MNAFASLVGAWDRASVRERVLVGIAATVVVLALFYGLAWPALLRDIERSRDDLARDRATLAYLQARVQPARATTGAAAASSRAASAGGPVDTALRASVARSLDAHGVAGAQVELRDAQVAVVIPAARFDALVGALDDIGRTRGLRVIEARLAARVEPGTVRAELTLGR